MCYLKAVYEGNVAWLHIFVGKEAAVAAVEVLVDQSSRRSYTVRSTIERVLAIIIFSVIWIKACLGYSAQNIALNNRDWTSVESSPHIRQFKRELPI